MEKELKCFKTPASSKPQNVVVNFEQTTNDVTFKEKYDKKT
jgi:hypothetical protein